MNRRDHLSFHRLHLLSAFAILLLVTTAALGQQTAARPDRGAMPGASYSVSDIENISLTNGNVNLSIPLASLPPIAGGKLKLTVSAIYNSKLWNVTRSDNQLSTFQGCGDWVVNTPQLSELGGWTITGGYRIEVRDAHEDFDYVVPDPPPAQTCESDSAEQQRLQYHYYRTVLITPDGAEHELRPVDTNAYYGINGGSRSYLFNYYKDTPTTTNSAMRYYSFDGSFIYAVINPSGSSTNWTIYLNDGTKVTQTSDGVQRITDTNGNSIKIYGDTSGVSHYQDEQTTRELKYSYDPAANGGHGQGQVQYQTVGGTWESVYLNFDTTTVQGKVYEVNDWNFSLGMACLRAQLLPATNISVIRQIVFPVTEPSTDPRKFTFQYNSDTSSSVTSTVTWACGSSATSYTRTASNGFGALSQMTTPSGAQINYAYSRDGVHLLLDADNLPRETITQKQVTHDSVTDTWTYNIDEIGGQGGTVTAPDGSITIETCYTHDPSGGMFFASVGKAGLVYRSNRSSLEMVERHWTTMPFSGANTGPAGASSGLVTFNPVVDAEYTSLLDGTSNNTPLKMSAKTYQYDFNGNMVSETDYDWFDPGSVSRGSDGVPTGVPAGATVLRTTSNNFYNGASGSSSSNVYAKRSLSTVTPLILNALQQSTTGPATAQLSYDGQAYGAAPTVGNLTSKSVWDNVDNKWITTSSTYGLYGNLATTIDGRGKVTQLFYDDATHAVPNRVVVDPQNGTGTQTTTYAFDYYTGLVTSLTDANGQTSTIDYTNQLLGSIDPFGRPGIAIGPLVNAGGLNQHRRVTTSYFDNAHQVVMAADLNAESDKLLKIRTTTDSLGRSILTEQTEDGINYTISVKSLYLDMGRVTLTSSPMRASAASTDSWTRVTKDTVGRVGEVATFGGAAQPAWSGTGGVWTGSVTTSYAANFTTVTDQIGKLRRSMVDALGRLVRVDEPDVSNSLGSSISPAQPTSYAYDVFGNLLTVTQGTQPPRTFNYDSLSRLRSAINPESGTVTYTYDDNGNLTQKMDARPVTSTYVYDALSRVTSQTYSDGTPAETYVYDAGSGVSNPKGRLISVSSSVSSYSYSGYDALGRVTGGTQTLGSQNYTLSYGYDLAGHVKSITYPSGHIVSYSFDSAGRLNSFSGNLGDGATRTYSTGILYSATGGLLKEQFGTNTPIYNKRFYNSRGQLAEIRESTSYTGPTDTDWNRGAIINHYSDQCWGMCFPAGVSSGMPDNNGNLKHQDNYIPDNEQISSYHTFTDSFAYDSLNRLQTVTENYYVSSTNQTTTPWQQSYSYDRFGNRTINTINQTPSTYGTGINNIQFAVDQATNRLYAPNDPSHALMDYDQAGNLKQDSYTGAGSRTYDAENRMTAAWGGNNQSQVYTYDANGQRVRRKVDNVETWQVYGLGGELVAEYPMNGGVSSPQKEYGYRNGQLLITAATSSSSASPPSGLTAAPSGGGATVTLSWTPASGATNYRLERKGAGGSYVLAGTTASTGFTDNGVSSGNAYLYRACAADGSGTCTSNYSNIALGTAMSFTDPTITSIVDDPTGVNVTKVKLEHVTELRTTVNAVRSLAGLAPASWTNPTLTRYVSQINADDIRDLRSRLDEALTALGVPTSAYDDPTLAGAPNGTPIRKTHISQLRLRATSGVGASGGGSSITSIQWLVTDQLGTPRMVFDQTGSLANVKRHDYLPFGEELYAGVGGRTTAQGYTADSVRQKFTQKERDIETGLDYSIHRYYASTQGRFTSPDPYVIFFEMKRGRDTEEQEDMLLEYISQPQNWSRYSYGLNNPLNHTDPTGMRPPNQYERLALDRLEQLATQADNNGDTDLANGLRGASAAIAGIIDALGKGKYDVGVNIAVNAVLNIGNPAYADSATLTVSTRGGSFTIGAGSKCNCLVASAGAQGAGLGFIRNGRKGRGFPLIGGLPPAANWLGDAKDRQHLTNLGIVTDGSLRPGDIVAWRTVGGTNEGHSSIHIGGNVLVYAGGPPDGSPQAQTLDYVNSKLTSFPSTWFTGAHEPYVVRRYNGKP